jgi:hypothetical protein
MALFEIPLSNQNPAFTFQADLDGRTYNFDFRWNGRLEQWKFDLLDSNLDPIVYGIPFIVAINLLEQIVLESRPPGEMFALNLKDAYVSADRFSIGGDVKLYYNEVET